MSTVTAHTLFSSRAAIYSAAGATSLGCPKPAAVSLPFAPNSGKKKARRSVCYYADIKSPEHPSNIPPTVLHLVHKPVMPNPITSTEYWKIMETTEVDGKKKVQLALFHMPVNAKADEFQVVLEADVLRVSRKSPNDDVAFDVQLVVPEFCVKDDIEAVHRSGSLLVTIPYYRKQFDVIAKN